MDLDRSLISEYESTLTGRRKVLSTFYFSYGREGNMRLALRLIQYSFETFLRWSPQDLRSFLTMDVMECLKLKSLIRYVVFPPELNPREDLFYIVWKIYPQTVHFSQKDLILRVYKNLLDGKIQKFPKEFFNGTYGVVRAQACLRYLIEHHMNFTSIESLYAFFASDESLKTLREYKLLVTCRDLYDSPLEFLHNTLAPAQRIEFLFQYHRFSALASAAANREAATWKREGL